MSRASNFDPNDLLKKLLSDEIDWQEALKAIPPLKKLWATKEWKEKRKEKIGSSCKKCGSTTPPLVIQHTWHPTPTPQLFNQERKEYLTQWTEWGQAHPIAIDTSEIVPDANGCPKCKSTTIRYRKRANTWICVSKPSGITCNYVFDFPVLVISDEAIRIREKAAQKNIQEGFDHEYGIGKKVAIKALRQHLQYISFANIKTLCKKCAFVEDKTSMVLCKVCNNKYHSKKYNKCSSCAGINTPQ